MQEQYLRSHRRWGCYCFLQRRIVPDTFRMLMQKIIDEDYSHIMIEYVQEMSACDESKVATSTHLNPKGQRTQRRIKSDLVKIFAGCFATAKKLNGQGVERDIAYSSYSRPFCSSQLTESQEQAEISLKRERVKIYRLVQLRNLNSNLISCKITFIFSMAANQRFKSRLSFTQMYLSMTKVNGTVSECQSGTNSVSIQERRLLQAQTSWTIAKALLKGYLTGTRGEDVHPSSILSLRTIITNRFLS